MPFKVGTLNKNKCDKNNKLIEKNTPLFVK